MNTRLYIVILLLLILWLLLIYGIVQRFLNFFVRGALEMLKKSTESQKTDYQFYN
jgi:hypothetical protein